MKNGFVYLTILLLLCCTITLLSVMSVNISNGINITPSKSQPDSNYNFRININTAEAEQLILLPGIGEELAQRIVEYREMHGKFTSLKELENVKGIGHETLNKICQIITIGG